MNRVFQNNSGSVAPLAILFTFISMLLMTAYLAQSATISSLEKYRFAEMRAQYVAEAGLNREAADFLPWLVNDTTLIGEIGVEFGLDSGGNPLGIYKNVACSTKLIPNTNVVEYRGVSTGEVNYTTTAGSTVTVQKTVFMSMVAEGMGRFMYFTNEEEPFGPPNENMNGSICFGQYDNLDGIIHTNGSLMSFCDYGACPEISESTELSVVDGITIDFGICSESDFQDEDGESIIDTVDTIVYPPENSIDNMRAHATREFTADDMISFARGRRDTLIMTEIEFVEEGGFFATQWWYLIPPVCSSNQLGYTYDPGSTNTQVMPGRLQLMDTGTGGEAYTTTGGYSTADSLIIHKFDITGSMVEDILAGFEFGDEIIIESLETDKRAEFRISTVTELFDRFVMRILGSVTYTSSATTGFNNNETLLLTRDGDCNELNTNIEFNNFENYHDHPDITMFGPVSMCRVDGFQHFDFRYWLCSNRYSENCADENGKSFVVMPRTYFPYSVPEVIYIRGGQVLVRGTVKGAYTVLTDEVIQYRRHDNSFIDQVWGNIWLIDDVTYADSAPNGEVAPPEEGGTENVLGLIAGGSVIIANTRENGARSQFSWSDPDIVINAAIMALRGGFLSHYWQNQVGAGGCPTCYLPNPDNPENSLGDGRGLARNGRLFGSPAPGENEPQTIDYRGTIQLWGQVVQQARGYMMRNNPGPYNGDDIGYNKNYHYDENIYNAPPPYWPRIETEDGRQTLKLRAYGNRP